MPFDPPSGCAPPPRSSVEITAVPAATTFVSSWESVRISVLVDASTATAWMGRVLGDMGFPLGRRYKCANFLFSIDPIGSNIMVGVRLRATAQGLGRNHCR